MKECRECKVTKPLSDFYKDKARPDGVEWRCKKCKNEYNRRHRQTDAGKNTIKRWNRSQGARDAVARYEKRNRERVAMLRKKRRKPKDKKKDRAQYLVRQAIKHGIIPHVRQRACQNCGEPAHHHHHYLGYDEGYELSVIPLCSSCHKKAHGLGIS